MPTPGGPRPSRPPRRSLAELAARAGALLPAGTGDRTVTGVTLNSQAVRPGDLYAALPGSRRHGAEFVAQAVRSGAVAVLTDPAGAELAGAAAVTASEDPTGSPGDLAGAGAAAGAGRSGELPLLVVDQPRAALGELAAWVYGEPATQLVTLGVTGTNGKTTTTFLTDAALRSAGRVSGLVGTVQLRAGDLLLPSTGTTPEAPDLHALLAVMLERGVTACAMEISSHAIDQRRVDGLVLDVAGFTNLSQDHLDYHQTMAEYFLVKARLFTPAHARRGIVCVDDEWGRLLAGKAEIPVQTLSTRRDVPADWTVTEQGRPGGRPLVRVHGPDGFEESLHCPLPGDFNIANSVLALALLVAAGVPAGTAARALAAAGPVPGRMEQVPGPGAAGEPLGVVDYAHSPDAVRVALSALRGSGRPLVVVLGAGGDRDREKRPLMGAAAAAGADVVVITDDNPRSEDPAAIRAAVLAGARERAPRSGAVVVEVPDRRAAIEEGVRRAWGGGVVLVAGKGHERGQDVGGVVHPFEDRLVLADALRSAAATATGPGGTIPSPDGAPAPAAAPATATARPGSEESPA